MEPVTKGSGGLLISGCILAKVEYYQECFNLEYCIGQGSGQDGLKGSFGFLDPKIQILSVFLVLI